MKRVLGVLVAIVMCCGLLAGCGSDGKPEEMNEDIYSYGVKAVEVIDSFLESDLTIDEAVDKTDALSASADSIETDESSDKLVQTNLSTLSLQFFTISVRNHRGSDVSSDDMSDLREMRETLKDLLNMK